MFKQQTMEVELSTNNAAVLKKPSKLFNKLKSTFSGEMTPTEKAQSEIILSIIQRLNIIFKKVSISHLAMIKVNDDTVYKKDEIDVADENIEVSIDKISKRLASFTFSHLDSIEILAQGVIGPIKYIVHAEVLRKPKKGVSPIQLKLTGLINDLSLQKNEDQEQLKKRVQRYIDEKYSDVNSAKSEDAMYEIHFSDFIKVFKTEVKYHFPGGLNVNSRKTYRGMADKNAAILYRNNGSRTSDFFFFGDALSYLHYSDQCFCESMDDVQGKKISDELGWEGPDNCFEDILEDSSDGDSSWFSCMESSDDNYSSCSSCSSCGGD